jgi:hypothetical protein
VARTVLFLEDDADQLDTLTIAIATFCHRECLGVHSYLELTELGERALAAEVAFLDVNLGPGAESGIDAYQWLRRSGFRGRIYFLTGHAKAHPRIAEALALADATVLEKPIAMGDLCAFVQGGAK